MKITIIPSWKRLLLGIIKKLHFKWFCKFNWHDWIYLCDCENNGYQVCKKCDKTIHSWGDIKKPKNCPLVYQGVGDDRCWECLLGQKNQCPHKIQPGIQKFIRFCGLF